MNGRLKKSWLIVSIASCVIGMVFAVANGDEPPTDSDDESRPGHPFDMRPQPWQRRDKPVLSANTTKQPWCKVVLYSPSVMFKDGKFKMWYVGTSTASRSIDFSLGYAESKDGIQWDEHAANPIATPADIGWGIYMQTPFVMFDDDEQIYKMWFSSATKAVYSEKSRRLVGADRYLMYYAPRDWRNTYLLPDGSMGRDGSGVYSHIGVAVIPKK
jgi:hypothetical protein